MTQKIALNVSGRIGGVVLGSAFEGVAQRIFAKGV